MASSLVLDQCLGWCHVQASCSSSSPSRFCCPFNCAFLAQPTICVCRLSRELITHTASLARERDSFALLCFIQNSALLPSIFGCQNKFLQNVPFICYGGLRRPECWSWRAGAVSTPWRAGGTWDQDSGRMLGPDRCPNANVILWSFEWINEIKCKERVWLAAQPRTGSQSQSPPPGSDLSRSLKPCGTTHDWQQPESESNGRGHLWIDMPSERLPRTLADQCHYDLEPREPWVSFEEKENNQTNGESKDQGVQIGIWHLFPQWQTGASSLFLFIQIDIGINLFICSLRKNNADMFTKSARENWTPWLGSNYYIIFITHLIWKITTLFIGVIIIIITH